MQTKLLIRTLIGSWAVTVQRSRETGITWRRRWTAFDTLLRSLQLAECIKINQCTVKKLFVVWSLLSHYANVHTHYCFWKIPT